MQRCTRFFNDLGNKAFPSDTLLSICFGCVKVLISGHSFVLFVVNANALRLSEVKAFHRKRKWKW